MKKIYIAGKINGLKNYREVFKAAEDKLIAGGNTVMNPAVLPEGFDYEIYLPICMLMLQACDAVYMLNNWENSKGAKVELQFAKAQGKEIIYQDQVFVGREYALKDGPAKVIITSIDSENQTAGVVFGSGIEGEVKISEIKY